MTRILLSTMAVIAALTGATLTADAGWRRPGNVAGEITVQSRHGNGIVSGIVREARYGYEVRLPGGTWVACRRSCEETLRVETVDYWENDGALKGGGTADNECGIFGCLDVGF